ncbi:type IV pilin protein [Herbaspirillum sp. RTI4]|uniref:type IV pilin protein n=1 Tax=Herbaspirillum sp. RTI4 TaxID=3048640 RepID=UPI002AB3A8BF|nr:type IV pilin protein [Herbaspirillum sp. RTI4]MDY7579805.1 type IV pilin protein [Herbaspirillum sp. RTI4]MEA9982590.1 type IV pilin protein [Herbaspirillum sp. RTI4]
MRIDKPHPTRHPPSRQCAGFTLIELLIALVIIGLLTSLALPAYQHVTLKNTRAAGRAALLQAMLQQERYFSANMRYLAFAAEQQAPPPFQGLSDAYQLSAQTCNGESLSECVLLKATPGGLHAHQAFKDPVCHTLTLDSRGVRGAAGLSDPQVDPQCWPQ